jgi:hypothetical protein
MNPTTLGYELARERMSDLHESAERSRRHGTTPSRVAAAAVRPPSERRAAVRAVLSGLVSR